MLAALDEFPQHQVLLTYPNSDNGGHRLIQLLEQYASERLGKVFAVPSLGMQCYLSAVSCSDAVIGNSSSGVIEVPSLRTPSVNIGVRQKGRLAADSVIHAGTSKEEIKKSIDHALSDQALRICETCENPYGDGETSAMIIDTLQNLKTSGPKKFYDLPGPQED